MKNNYGTRILINGLEKLFILLIAVYIKIYIATVDELLTSNTTVANKVFFTMFGLLAVISSIVYLYPHRVYNKCWVQYLVLAMKYRKITYLSYMTNLEWLMLLTAFSLKICYIVLYIFTFVL